MNKPSDPMQGFLEQLLQDWESGGTKTPSTAKSAKTPSVGTIVETPGVASVVRALPELAEAVSLNAVDEAPPAAVVFVAAPLPPLAPLAASVAEEQQPAAAPAVAQTPWPTISWEPAAPVAEAPPVAEATPAAASEQQFLPKPTFQWKPLAELAPAESASSEATPIRVVVPSQPPVAATSPAPAFEEASAAFAPASSEYAKPVFQWKPAPPPSAAAASSKAEADPLEDTAPQFSKPSFQWKPAAASPAATTIPEARQEDTQAAPPPVEQSKPAFQWKLSQPSTAAAAPAPEPAPAPVSAVPSTPPALVDFAAALSALKASRPVKAAEPVIEQEIAEPAAAAEALVGEPIALLKEEALIAEEAPEELTVVEPAGVEAETVLPAPEMFLLPEPEPDPEPVPFGAETAMDSDEEALLTSLLYEQKAPFSFDQWDEPIPEAEPSGRFAAEELPEPQAEEVAVEPEESVEPEVVFQAEAALVETEAAETEAEIEAASEPEIVAAAIEPPAAIAAAVAAIEAGEPIVEPAVPAFDRQSLTTAVPEWEEIALPPQRAATAGTGKELASAVSALETTLPAGQWDQAAGARRLDLRRHLVFSINDEKFAVNLDNLVEIDNMPTWTGIPGLPNSVRGLINLRGEIVSLLELRAILGLPHPEVPKKGKIFVATTSDRQAVSAFAVDDIEGIVGFDPARMTAIPDMTATKASRNITATVEDGDRLIRILDVGSVLTEIEQTFSLDQVWM